MDPCGSAKELSKSIIFKCLVLGKSIICFIAVFFVIYLLYKKRTRWIPHPNAKVLYLNHLFWSTLAPMAFGACYGFDFIRLSIYHENPCDYTLKTGFILKTRLLPVSFLNIQSTTMLAFAIERVFSTLCPLNYESVKSPRLGVILVILSVIGVATFECSTMFIDVKWEQPLSLYSIKTRDNSYYYQLTLYIFAGIEVAAILIFSLALWKNHQMFKVYKVARVNSLRIKYQITENRRLIRTLLPCFVFHFILSFSTYISIALYPFFYPIFDVVSFGVWLETVSQSNLYSLGMPLLLIYTLTKQENINVTDNIPQIDTYFTQFQQYLTPPNMKR